MLTAESSGRGTPRGTRMRIGEIGAGPAVGIPNEPIRDIRSHRLAHIRDRAGPSQWRLKSDSKTAWRSGETTRTIERSTIHDERNVIGTAITTTAIGTARAISTNKSIARHSSEGTRRGSAISGGNQAREPRTIEAVRGSVRRLRLVRRYVPVGKTPLELPLPVLSNKRVHVMPKQERLRSIVGG